MAFEYADNLLVARKLLRSPIPRVRCACHRTAVSRSYYAVYPRAEEIKRVLCARDSLMKESFRLKVQQEKERRERKRERQIGSHEVTILFFQEALGSDEVFQLLEELRRLRTDADYYADRSIDRTDAGIAIKYAQRVRPLLETIEQKYAGP